MTRMIFVFQMLYELIAADFSNLFIFPLQLLSECAR